MELISGLVDVPLWSLLLPVALILFYVYATWTHSTWSKQGIKGPYPIPYMGSIIISIFKGGFYHTDIDLWKKYGKFMGLYTGRTPVLGVSDPEFLRKAMVKEFSSMPNRFSFNIGGIFNLFLTALKDDHWRHVRASLTPTFTTGKLKQMVPLINDCTDSFAAHLKETQGKPFDAKRFAGCYTMDVIASTAFGIHVDSQKNPDDPILEYARELMGSKRLKTILQKVKFALHIILFFFMPAAFLRLCRRLNLSFVVTDAMKYFEKLIMNILEQRQEERENRRDFVQLCKEHMIEDPKLGDPDTQVDQFGDRWSTKGLTKNEIIANALAFFLAGFETTAISLSLIFFELACNPDIQEKVYQEIQLHCKSNQPTYEEVSKMEYLDMVIDEALRMYPPGARLDRQVTRDVEIDGIHLPAGSLCTAMVYAMHHDPEIYPDPFKFDPERFTPENKASRHSCAYMPFGIGNRNCIAMRLALLEIKLAVVKILSRFELKRCPGSLDKPVVFKKGFILGTEKPNELRAVSRIHSEDA